VDLHDAESNRFTGGPLMPGYFFLIRLLIATTTTTSTANPAQINI
jgi:hypothetical protein